MLSLANVFLNLFKEQGEAEVLTSISKLLKNKSGVENYYLVPKAALSDENSSVQIDLLLLHPILGIFAIEVKNWTSLDVLKNKNSPYEQANNYKNMALNLLQKEFGKIPINVEYRVIFPSISKQEGRDFFDSNPDEKKFKNHTFFKDDLQDRDIFGNFFKSSTTTSPNKKEFEKISSLLVPARKIKDGKNRIVPVITKDEILFFDQKQLSVMNGYKGDFRIIRGVAGTGKTIILTNFVCQRLSLDESEKFLILCFNKTLSEEIKNSFGKNYNKKSIAIYSIMGLLTRIGFDDAKVGITSETNIDEKYKIYESDAALAEFQDKFSNHLKSHPIDYVLCDETQDMPAGFMRIIYEEIKDCIFFIDEAQKFFSYTMNSIADIFHHKKFDMVNMSGRVKNLTNVYRTPSNIAHCAFKMLSFDASLNQYYKKSYYLKNSFLTDINCVLEDGDLILGDYDDFAKLEVLVKSLPKDESNAVLTHSNSMVESIKNILIKIKREDVKVMTMQSVKGLEAQNVIIHQFEKFIKIIMKNEKEILFRKVYVLLTRAKERLYVSMPSNLLDTKELNDIQDTLREYENKKVQKQIYETTNVKSSAKLRLAKIRPVLHDVKDSTELVVAASELFAIISGLFAL